MEKQSGAASGRPSGRSGHVGSKRSQVPSTQRKVRRSPAAAAVGTPPPKQRSVAPAKKVKSPSRPYLKAIEWLMSATDYEQMKRVGYNSTNFNLSRMQRLVAALDNPQRTLKFVHVAGTKGKGSVATMTARMLEACGMKVGLYTSPHILDIRERISINGQDISEEAFTRSLQEVEKACAKLAKTGDQPTFFEIMTASAFLHFAAETVDIAVLEVGLGGRLDATNVIKPEVAAITSISFDHMDQLGNTLEKIATEKGGIIKEGVPVILYPQGKEIDKQLRRMADELNAPVLAVGKEIDFTSRFENDRATGPHIRVCVTSDDCRFDHVRVPLPGEHQGHNLAMAFGILGVLKSKGMPIDEARALVGLETFSIPGRMEMHMTDPRIIIDGAHNASSVEALMKSIGQSVPYDSMVVIFGCGADKDIAGMMQQVQLGADKIIFTKAKTGRAYDPELLAKRYEEISGKMAQVAPNIEQALKSALAACTREDVICVTGSFYLVGEAKKALPELKLPSRKAHG